MKILSGDSGRQRRLFLQKLSKKDRGMLFLAFFILIFTTLFVLFRKEKTESTRVERPISGEETISVLLTCEEVKEKFLFPVSKRVLSREELSALFKSAESELTELMEKLIMQCRAAQLTDEAEVKLQLPEQIGSTGISVAFYSEDAEFLSNQGELFRENATKEEEVLLRAVLSFQEELSELWFSIPVLPYKEGSVQEQFWAVKRELMTLEQESREASSFSLPVKIGSVAIQKIKKKSKTWILVLFLIFFLPLIIVVMKRQEKQKKEKQREEDYLWFYPQMVTRLTLYISAGLSFSSAFQKMASELRVGKEKRRFLPEELLVLAGELQNGTPGEKAYRNLAKRLPYPPYQRLCALLISQLEKGAGGLRERMLQEVETAWEQHRRKWEEKGEEAQTKLLLPMTGMLFLVLLVVMIPAFFGMGV